MTQAARSAIFSTCQIGCARVRASSARQRSSRTSATVVASCACNASSRARSLLELAGEAVDANLLLSGRRVRAWCTVGLVCRTDGAELAGNARDAVGDGRHDRQRCVLSRAARAREWRSAASRTVVSSCAVLTRGLPGARLELAGGAIGARCLTRRGGERARSARRMGSRARGASRARWACCAFGGRSEARRV